MEAGAQISPRLTFPLGTLLTVHVTAGFAAPLTVAVKLARWLTATDAVAGATVTDTGATLMMVTAAETDCEPATARIVTGFVVGMLAGAVYVAVVAPVLVMVPMEELPPAMLLTSHVIAVPAATHKEAENVCDAPTEILAEAGEIAFGAAQEIVTLALADFDGSATLVAVTVRLGGVGASAGAGYVAESAPVAVIVPTVEFPPATLLTLQLTATLEALAPVTVALKFADAPGATFAELGAMLTTMPL